MRRVLPLCAIFAAASLLLAGVWTSMAADAPVVPAQSELTSNKATVGVGGATESKWTETFKLPPKKSP